MNKTILLTALALCAIACNPPVEKDGENALREAGYHDHESVPKFVECEYIAPFQAASESGREVRGVVCCESRFSSDLHDCRVIPIWRPE